MAANYFSTIRKSFIVKIIFNSIISNLFIVGQPIQEMIVNYYNKENAEFKSSTSYNKSEFNENKQNTYPDSHTQFLKKTKFFSPDEMSTIFFANEKEGTVGKLFESDAENPYDNFFTIHIPETIKVQDYDAVLSYELYGLAEASQATKSINNHSSYGGKMLTITDKWTLVQEDIVGNHIRSGTNEIFFNRRVDENYEYSVKNVRLELKRKTGGPVHSSEKLLTNFKGNVYLLGVVSDPNIKNVEVLGTTITVHDGVFENIFTNIPEDTKELNVFYTDIKGKRHSVNYNISYIDKDIKYQFKESVLESNIKTYSLADLVGSAAYGDISISIDKDHQNKKGKLKIEGLRFKDIKTLNHDIENVTLGDFTGYRIKKHNISDSIPLQLHIKYDTAKIPDGYTAGDIRTFYFDKNKRDWKALPVDSLDRIKNEIISTAFANETDYINGVIKVPDSPETGSFTPTTISDMKYADPSAGIVSIPPPSANSTGSASTSFPLKLPQGRNGMQPSLEVSYNSEGGNNWMGIGWNLSTPSISLNTKWGAPLFDAAYETELYSMGGADLVLKNGTTYTNPHRQANIARTGERIFYQRKEGSYQKIIRHGSSPANYWWEVIDKIGNKTFYGGYTGSGVSNNAVITSDGVVGSNIVHWAITRAEDPFGNYIEYIYSDPIFSDIGLSTIKAREFYPLIIRYTRHGSMNSNYYEIEFKRNSYSVAPLNGNTTFTSRNDVILNAKNGYLQKIDDLLTEVHISLVQSGTPQRIRTYRFDYEPKAFLKQQLIRISEFDTEGKLFYSNSIDYYEMEGSNIIGAAIPWSSGSNDPIDSPIPPLSGVDSNGSALGTSSSKGYSFGFRGGLGYGIAVWNVNLSAGGSFNYSKNTNETIVNFTDVNGDGLPDKLLDNGTNILYRPNTGQGFGSLFLLGNVGGLSKTKSRTFGGGADVSFGPISVGKSWNKTKSETDNYFTDINGDGLADYISNGVVKFNVTSSSGNTINRTFVNNVTSSENSIVPGSISQDIVPFLKFDTMEELREQNPQFDHVKLWEAPFTGTVNIEGTAKLINKNSDVGNHANQFSITIEKGTSTQISGMATPLYAPSAIMQSNGSSISHNLANINVNKGDKIFFRIHNKDIGYGGKLEWNPKITYTLIGNLPVGDLNMFDEDGNQYKTYDSKSDFILNNDEGIEIPYNDTSISIDFNLVSSQFPAYAFSDDIRFYIKLYKTVAEGDPTLVTTWYRDYIHGTGSPANLTGSSLVQDANAKYSLKVYAESTSNVKWKAINWKPKFTGNNSGVHYLPANFYNYDDNVNQSKYWVNGSTLPTPVINATVPGDANQPMMVFSHNLLNQNFSSLLSAADPGTIFTANWITKQQTGTTTKVLYKRIIYLIKTSSGVVLSKTNNVVNPSPISPTSSTDLNYRSFTLTKQQVKDIKDTSSNLFSAFYISDKAISCSRNITLGVDPGQAANYSFSSTFVNPFIAITTGFIGSPYRGWSQFLYNGGLSFEHDNEGNITNSTPVDFGSQYIDMSIFDTQSQANNLNINENTPAEDIDISDAPMRYMTYNQDRLNSKYINKAVIDANYGLNTDNSLTVTVGRFGEGNLWDIYVDPNTITSPPVNGNFIGIKQRSESKGSSVSGGASFAGGTESKATSAVLNQYIDLNGDRYPDLVTGGKIQYTNMLGSLFSKFSDNSFTSGDESKDQTVGATISSILPASTEATNAKTTGNKTNTYISSGINAGSGESFNFNQWADMNGDGLPDKVKIIGANVKVALNTGYSFTTEIPWYTGSQTYRSSSRSNVSTGISGGQNFSFTKSYAFGLGAAKSTANMETMLVDVNGDGLPDLVFKESSSSNTYRYVLNKGDGFTGSPAVFYNGLIEQDESASANVFGAFTYGIPFKILLLSFKVVMTPSLGANSTLSQKNVTLQDINGDGLIDVIKKGTANNSNITAQLNQMGKTYLLKKVNTPLGGSWTVDYTRTGNTYDMPQSKWVLTEIKTDDGFTADNAYKPDSTLTAIVYNNPKYDRREREFFGFETVSVQQKNPSTLAVFRTNTTTYHNDNYYLSGAPKSTALFNQSGQLLSESNTLYNLLDPDAPVVNLNATVDNNYLQNSLSNFASLLLDQSRLFVAVAKTTTTNYEGGQSMTAEKYFTAYDAYGNVTTYVDMGEGLEDAYRSVIEYYPLSSVMANTTGFPKKISVYKHTTNQLYRQRTAVYNNKGKLGQITTKLNQTENNNVSFIYNAYGNLIKVTEMDNLNASGTPFATTIGYDTVLSTYPVSITNLFGEYSTSTYNYLFGVPVLTQKTNNQVMRTRIDNRGRVVEITGPNEMALEPATFSAWTIRMNYEGEAATLASNLTPTTYMITATGAFPAVDPDAAQPTTSQHYAVTRHFDPEYVSNPNNPTVSTNQLLTVSITDGFGQPVQVKKTHLSGTTGKWMVSGFEKKDAFGRTLETYLPVVTTYTSNINALSSGDKAYYAPAASALKKQATMTYDDKDRVKTVKQVDESEDTEIAYAIEDGMFVQKVTNERDQTNDTYTDIRGRQRKAIQNGEITTTFEYNAINELMRVVDTKGFVTSYIYDQAGRKTEVQHPDRGVTTMKYNKIGNIIEQSNSNLLLAGGLKINYTYDFDRLTKVTYPQNPQKEIKYTYGLNTDTFAVQQNAVGRLLTQEDATGVQVFGYGLMGEVTKNLRSVAVAGFQSYWFYTVWKYDSWNRVQEIFYPDQERVSYSYNTAGALNGISSTMDGISNVQPIVSSIIYDDYGDRSELVHGNGTHTYYSYDSRRRLKNLVNSFTGFQINKIYAYDALSNITGVTTSQPTTSLPAANQIGGPVNHIYEYDEYNRLFHATGNYTGPKEIGTPYYIKQSYDLVMEYNTDHTIKKKTQIQNKGLVSSYGGAVSAEVPVYKNSYVIDYADYAKGAFVAGSSSYGYMQPHAPRTITESPGWVSGLSQNDPLVKHKEVVYDANGNQLEIKEKVGELTTSLRKNLWDEENLLMAVDLKPDDKTGHPIAIYTYDASGERTVRYNVDRMDVSSNATEVAQTYKDNVMMYPSGLIMGKALHNSDQGQRIDRMSYTKHYYIGSERISAKTGTVKDMGLYPASILATVSQLPNLNTTAIRSASTTTVTDAVTAVKTVYTKFGLPLPALNPMTEGTLVRYDHIPSKLNIYYFHPDHLGSAAYITNAAGTVSQHMEYLPFGETLVDEHTNSFNSPFKFNGKEFDEETGNYYYSARYYDPKWSIFISVDPLAERTMDAYGYCYQNPINLIDPTGMEADGFYRNIANNAIEWFDGNDEIEGYENLGVNFTNSDGSWGSSEYGRQVSFTPEDGFHDHTPIELEEVTIEAIRTPSANTSGLSMSEKGLDFLTRAEGVVLKPYNDSEGYATIGVGHLIGKRNVTAQDKSDWAWMKTRDDAMGLLKKDLANTYEPAVRSLIHVPLSQSQYDATVSFTFNVGIGGLKKSNFLRELNKGNYNGDLMLRYKRPSSILGRRQKEVNLFNNGIYK